MPVAAAASWAVLLGLDERVRALWDVAADEILARDGDSWSTAVKALRDGLGVSSSEMGGAEGASTSAADLLGEEE